MVQKAQKCTCEMREQGMNWLAVALKQSIALLFNIVISSTYF